MTNFMMNNNKFGGIDLIIEDDNDNLLAFNTGNAQHSKEFWRRMKSVAQSNMDQLEDVPTINAINGINEI